MIWRAMARASPSGSTPCADSMLEGRTLHKLHDQRGRAARRLEAVDLRDVRMVEGRERPRLALEPGEPLGIVGDTLREHFERHVASERGVAGAVDLPHASGAYRGDDLVGTEPRAGRQGHG